MTFRDRAVYLPGPDAIVVADLHLGRSRTSNVELPLPESGPITGRLDALLEAFRPETVVFAGDVCHAFDGIPDGVAESVAALEQLVAEAGSTAVFLEGNHDTMLGALVEQTAEYRLSDGTVVCHGHERPSLEAERYVLGHDHPAIEVEGCRYPCWLHGQKAYNDADVLVLPPFNELVRGTLVNGRTTSDQHSPLLSNLTAFRPIVLDPDDGEALVFPPLERLREHL